MRYEDFIPLEDIATFQRVKKMQMNLARISREVITEMLKPHVLRAPKVKGGKEFLHTTQGLFRLANRPNSDNTTEEAAHDSLGAVYIDMSNDEMLQRFLSQHDPSVTVEEFKMRTRTKLADFAMRQPGSLKVYKRAA